MVLCGRVTLVCLSLLLRSDEACTPLFILKVEVVHSLANVVYECVSERVHVCVCVQLYAEGLICFI